MVGTNPIAVAVPDGTGGCAISIDQSASVVAKSEIIKWNRDGRPIPADWAFGPDGEPTTDPGVALQGTMAPAGGYKGVGLALLVEVLAAAATGATPSIDASPFSGTAGGPPRTGQFCIALSEFASRIDRLVSAFADQPGAHLPGSGRQQKRRQAPLGIRLTAELVVRARQLAGA